MMITQLEKRIIKISMSRLVVVALGGNALFRSNQKGTYSEQIQNVTETCEALMSFVNQDCKIIIGHGNGPQVGNVMLQHEAGAKAFNVQAMPMDFCVSETQGSIGYLIETGFRKVMAQNHVNRNIVTLVTQVVVEGQVRSLFQELPHVTGVAKKKKKIKFKREH